ncbi:hypothetical protein RJ55_05020 [Drechmeria coniospora]|nr:hypothetical protein RJ55_05020 [Drechmeria coniospora]
MSIDLDWETLTQGPDGDALAERIRSFVHDKFQTVPLPRFIRAVNVHGFEFGTIAPALELKDITDPLPDFYEQELDDDEASEGSDDDGDGGSFAPPSASAVDLGAEARLLDRRQYRQHQQHQQKQQQQQDQQQQRRHHPTSLKTALRGGDFAGYDLGSPFLGTSTPGILGGPGLNYFQSHLGTGTHTPLAAVAGAHLGNGGWIGSSTPVLDLSSYSAADVGTTRPSHSRQRSESSIISSVDNFLDHPQHPASQALREKSSVSTLAPTSVSTSRPPTRDTHILGSAAGGEGDDDNDDDLAGRRNVREARVEDVQAVFRIRYAGDIKLNLTAEILLDYPMPSFVGIPLKLNITGMSFDGVGVLANIRKRVHFCFLSPEDAAAAVGSDEAGPEGETEGGGNQLPPKGRLGGLLQEIKVESEIGERDGGKQSLKNVGKVERFVLEQVRRIFDEEFVYPSFWTFLV